METVVNKTQDEIYVYMVLSAWQTQNARVDNLLNKISDEQLMQETAPGKNTGVYLLGHLAAINDNLFTLLNIGERLHPELDDIFLNNPDKSGKGMPSINELKQYWKEINTALTNCFNKMPANEWFQKHTAVSADDFIKEPHRNRLNVIITRTVHQGYHLGQMIYLKQTSVNTITE